MRTLKAMAVAVGTAWFASVVPMNPQWPNNRP